MTAASAPAPDLASLNTVEREVLMLLAEGHTAKTIAAELDRSVGAVNERLREARRKTGMGSSRELARLLAAQENRDKRIGWPGRRHQHQRSARRHRTQRGGAGRGDGQC